MAACQAWQICIRIILTVSARSGKSTWSSVLTMSQVTTARQRAPAITSDEGNKVMDKFKKILVTVLAAVLCVFAFAGCTGQSPKEPLDVKKVSYLIYCGDIQEVRMYVITSDLKVTQYIIWPEDGTDYDYFAGELPTPDKYEVTESEMTEENWKSMVDALTEADFMTLLEEFTPDDSMDASTYYIKVETADGVHQSGGYNAGGHMDPESRRYSDARQAVERALNLGVY